MSSNHYVKKHEWMTPVRRHDALNRNERGRIPKGMARLFLIFWFVLFESFATFRIFGRGVGHTNEKPQSTKKIPPQTSTHLRPARAAPRVPEPVPVEVSDFKTTGCFCQMARDEALAPS